MQTEFNRSVLLGPCDRLMTAGCGRVENALRRARTRTLAGLICSDFALLPIADADEYAARRCL